MRSWSAWPAPSSAATLALTLSVWGRKTHEVLLATYAFGILYLLAAPIWAGLVSRCCPGGPGGPGCPATWPCCPTTPIFLVLAPFGGSPPGLVPDRAVRDVPWPGPARLGLLIGRRWLVRAAATWQLGRWSIRQAGRGGVVARAGRPRSARPVGPGSARLISWCLGWPRRRSTATRCSGASGIGGGPSRWTVAVWGLFGVLSRRFQPLGDRRALGGSRLAAASLAL